jgi:hypothetical protein
VPVLVHDAERQEPGADDEGSSHEVSVYSVPSRTPPCLDLDDNAEVIVHRVHLVRDPLSPEFTEEDRSSDPLVPMLT